MKLGNLPRSSLLTILIGGRFLFPSQSGYYLDETESRLPNNLQISEEATIGDVDLDGDMDIVVANFYTTLLSGQNRLLINDGSGYFVDESELRLPSGDDATFDIALLDVDGDGDLDYMAANTYAGGAPNGNNCLYLNNGSGHF